MLQIKRILAPTDYSACAEHSVQHAAYLADQYGAELHVLHVFLVQHRDEEPRQGAADPGPERDEAGVVHAEMERESVPLAILEYADAHDIDLIVMGTHGRTGLEHLLLGSVAEKVVRRATQTVFTVCEGARPGRAVRRILVPLDFSEPSRLALRYASELARTYGAHLALLHVVENVLLPGIYGMEPVPVDTPEVKARAREALQEMIREEDGSEQATFEVKVGHAVDAIVDYAKAQEVDLIVIATHGRTGLKHFLLGSVAENVVRMAPCPVFTVKNFGKSLLPPRPAS